MGFRVRACVLCGVVGAPLVALDVPVPFVPPPFLLSYSPCMLWFLRCLLGLWWSYPFPFPLSMIVVVWCLLSLGSRLLVRVRRVFLWPPWSSRIPPPVTVSVGTWECVVCDLALWYYYWQRSWLPLSSWVSDPFSLSLCVPLYCLFTVTVSVSVSVSRDDVCCVAKCL